MSRLLLLQGTLDSFANVLVSVDERMLVRIVDQFFNSKHSEMKKAWLCSISYFSVNDLC